MFDLQSRCLLNFPGFVGMRREVATVNTLIVSLTDFPDEGIAIRQTLTAAEIQPAEAADVDTGPITLDGHLDELGGAYTFTGTLTGSFRGECDRCLERAEAPFAIRVVWTYLESDPDVADDEWETGSEELEDGALASTLAYGNDEIDLGRAVWEEIILAVPSKFPPLDAERRHCTVCGKDIEALLSDDRAPSSKFENSGLAGLKDMFPDLPKGPDKE